jgi:hypothetical protein
MRNLPDVKQTKKMQEVVKASLDAIEKVDRRFYELPSLPSSLVRLN